VTDKDNTELDEASTVTVDPLKPAICS